MSDADKNSPYAALLFLVAALPLALWKGFVLTRLWGWFVLPMGAPGLGIWQAAGIALTVGWLTTNRTYKKNDDEPDILTTFLMDVFLPLGIWAFGAIYHALMIY